MNKQNYTDRGGAQFGGESSGTSRIWAREIEVSLHFLDRDVETGAKGKVFMPLARWQSSFLKTVSIPREEFFRELKQRAKQAGQEEVLLSAEKALKVKRYEGRMKLCSVMDEILIERAVDNFINLFEPLDIPVSLDQREAWMGEASGILTYLHEAMEARSEPLFLDYVRGVRSQKYLDPKAGESLLRLLVGLLIEIDFKVAGRARKTGMKYLESAIHLMGEEPEEGLRITRPEPSQTDLSEKYLAFMTDRQARIGEKWIRDQLAAGLSLREVYLDILWKANELVCQRTAIEQMSLLQERYFADQTRSTMSRLNPWGHLEMTRQKSMISVSMGEEWPGIGLRILTDFFELEGWESYYLGGKIPDPGILSALTDWQVDLVLLAVPTTLQVNRAKELIEKMRSPGGPSVSIMVFGEPCLKDPDLWQKMGADGMVSGPDAGVELARKLVG